MYVRTVVCGDDIFVIGYDESAVMHRKRKCTVLYCTLLSLSGGLTSHTNIRTTIKNEKLMRHKWDIYNINFALIKRNTSMTQYPGMSESQNKNNFSCHGKKVSKTASTTSYCCFPQGTYVPNISFVCHH